MNKTNHKYHRYQEERVLSTLLRCDGAASVEDLVEDTLLYPSDLSRALDVLNNKGLISHSRRSVTVAEPFRKNHAASFQVATETITRSLEIFRTVHRPEPKLQFDQCTTTAETTAGRFLYLFARGDLHRKRVLFLGDDDLVSIPVGLAHVAQSVHVLDIDDRVLSLIAKVAVAHGFAVETQGYDVRESLPPKLTEYVDVVVIDPPYTVAGIGVFLGRAAEALQNRLGSVCYLSYSTMDLNPEEIWTIQEMISRTGFIITDVVPGFNRYYPRQDMVRDVASNLDHPTWPWFRSSWIRLEAAHHLKADVEPSADIYAYANTP